MIKIVDVTIENFRSIAGEPFEFEFEDYCVVVGPNNSGKSNILRAMQLFFNGTIDGHEYDSNIDFPKTKTVTPQSKTKITITLSFDPKKDVSLHKAIGNLERESNQTRLRNNLVRLRLEFTKRNTSQWRFFSRAGLRSIRADLIQPVVDVVRLSIHFKYLPVGRDILGTIRDELSEELIRTIFSGWSGAVAARTEINAAIKTLISKLQPRLTSSGEEITRTISTVFGEVRKMELQLPFDNLENLLPSLIPTLQDQYETPLNQKGSGLQTSTLLFLLKYLADHHPQRHNLRVTYIWAIEEPESYLHPSNQKNMSNILMEFSDVVQTIITTHSPHFVPRTDTVKVLVVDKASDRPFSTCIVSEEYEMARQALGVSLLDSMYLYPYNLVVEGPSDIILLQSAWQKLFDADRAAIDPNDIRFFPGNGANGACTLYESMLIFGDSEEVQIRLIIDGDDAGTKALNGLLKRLSSDFPIKPNSHYFILDHDVEWLTSGEVMVQMSKKFTSAVQLVENTEDLITSFSVSSGKKKKVAAAIMDASDLSQLDDFEKVILRIESSF